MLSEVESLYGPRDSSWTILGVEIGPDIPQLWYPGDRKHVLVQLGVTALNDAHRAYYQLAHECVHLLSPTGTSYAPVLEEGLATVYSEDYMKSQFGTAWHADLPSYVRAASLVRELLAINPAAVRLLRAEVPSFEKLDETSFSRVGLNVGQKLAAELVKPFVRQ
jgi:hypothetical protein